MVIQEKLNFLVENKDTDEVKYPHVYKLFHDLENYQEKKVFEIWMEKIAEPISVRIDFRCAVYVMPHFFIIRICYPIDYCCK